MSVSELARQTVHAHLVTTCPGDEPGKRHWPQCDNAVNALLRFFEQAKRVAERVEESLWASGYPPVES